MCESIDRKINRYSFCYGFYTACTCSYMNLGLYSMNIGGKNESAFTRNRIIKKTNEGIE